MGYGDEIIGTGLARGAQARGKRIAFGDGTKIQWGPWCAEMFRLNPNIAPPGAERSPDIEWVDHYKGHRLYNRQDHRRWIWNYDFKVTPGEFFFDKNELHRAAKYVPKSFILMEPNVPWQKTVHPNKDWGEVNYQTIADCLMGQGYAIKQFRHKNSRRLIKGARTIETTSFRDAISILSKAALYIGPEGGLHHASAAVHIPAVVLFGGFIPPIVMGYDNQTCLTGGAEACGNMDPCKHCAEAMKSITVGEVLDAALRHLNEV